MDKGMTVFCRQRETTLRAQSLQWAVSVVGSGQDQGVASYLRNLFQRLQEGHFTRAKLPLFPLRPKLSELLAAVDSYHEKGFKSGRSLTKNLLAGLYEGPLKFRDVLASVQNSPERDDAVASFARTLLETGSQGGRLLRDLPLDIKKTLLNCLEDGNSWSPQKKAIYLTLARLAGSPANRFPEGETNGFLQRYQGVI